MSLHDQDTYVAPLAKPLFKGAVPPGTQIGRYVIAGLVAQGGGGAVYAARPEGSRRRAAIKVMHGALASSPRMVERFIREVEMVRQLHHPNIIEIFELGELPDGRPFYAMEYLDGTTLDALLDAKGRLSLDEVLAILEPVCAALAVAHDAGIVHRDVKASNISIGPDGSADGRRIKLLDFGIAKLLPEVSAAKLTSDGRRLGTPIIMAPEQILGEPCDRRIDIYALGILLYRMLTGRLPFEATNLGDLVRQHLEEPAPRPSAKTPVPPALDQVVLRCLEKQPERRYESVTHFLAALRDAIGGSPRADEGAKRATSAAVGVYFELRVDANAGELDAALACELGRILDVAETRLRDGGFRLPLVTGNEILAVFVLPGDPTSGRVARRAALDLAAALHDELRRRPSADSRAGAAICVHAGEAELPSTGAPDVFGGPIACASEWAAPPEASGLFATATAVEGLAGFALAPFEHDGPRAASERSRAPARGDRVPHTLIRT